MAKKSNKPNSNVTKKPAKRDAKSAPVKIESGADGRVSQRVPIQMLVDYRSNGNYLFDFCKDLGAGGVFIQTSSPLPQGSTVHLTFTLPDSKETLQASGTVIWVQSKINDREDCSPGMGVQFSEFGKKDRQVLEEFVRRYSSNQASTSSKSA